ncbi:MAG: nuclear transport factor 2 family protein [Verrucomicrobiota bacterium]|nr:nuclear transport factor 2 family protein [Verrucomicrobiota bacterium]
MRTPLRSQFVYRLSLLAILAGNLLTLTLTAAAGTLSSKDDAAIAAVMSAQSAAWNRGDIDGFMDGYDRSSATEFVSGDKLTRGWQTVRDRYRKKYDSREKMGTLTFSNLKITLLGADAALVLGRWTLVRKADKPHGIFTLLFRRTRAGWRIVHDHTSSRKNESGTRERIHHSDASPNFPPLS